MYRSQSLKCQKITEGWKKSIPLPSYITKKLRYWCHFSDSNKSFIIFGTLPRFFIIWVDQLHGCTHYIRLVPSRWLKVTPGVTGTTLFEVKAKNCGFNNNNPMAIQTLWDTQILSILEAAHLRRGHGWSTGNKSLLVLRMHV